MIKVTILCVGKVKEKFFRDAIAEYQKRLTRYCKPIVTEVADEKTPEDSSENQVKQIKDKEGERLLSHIKDDDYVIAMALDGAMLSSEELSRKMETEMLHGASSVVFLIGGSLGLSDAALKRANAKVCFGKVTYPHQLMRVILSEQIYRAFKIMKKEPYHK